jgi:hypothetical protein
MELAEGCSEEREKELIKLMREELYKEEKEKKNETLITNNISHNKKNEKELEERNKILKKAWIEQGKKYNEDIRKIRVEVEERNRGIITTLNQRKTELEQELQMEREEAKKALEKAKEWRERQIKEATEKKDKEKAEAIRNLEKEKQEKINQLAAEKNAAIQKIESEKNKKIRELEQEKQKLEKSQEQIRNQVLQERGEWEDKLRNRVNDKLEWGGFFKPSKKGEDLEEATDNLLEKQGKLENRIKELDKEIQQTKTNYQNEKERLKQQIDHALSRSNLITNRKSKSLEAAINQIIAIKIEGQQYQPSRKEMFCNAVGAKWLSNKIGSGITTLLILLAAPMIFTGLGWVLKAWIAIKTGGTAGAAFTVANGMINHQQNNQGGNLPPNYQPLPPAENIQNLPPVINNHYHNLPAGKQENNWKKKKEKKNR